jgi:hypothetical protein
MASAVDFNYEVIQQKFGQQLLETLLKFEEQELKESLVLRQLILARTKL